LSPKLELQKGNTKIRICADCVVSPEEQKQILKQLGKLLGGEVFVRSGKGTGNLPG